MTTICIEPSQKSGEVLHLVRSAIESEIAKLELALKMAVKRLAPFEKKYGVTSEYFMAEMTVEDLGNDGNDDDEYVRWAGEYKLMQRLQEKLCKLKEITYNDPILF
ncbi:MAG: hypothetical protein GY795_08900 [Desulfobacterales bacterium]|nr:hypothetical protein [Desulfobacterales bacterium]